MTPLGFLIPHHCSFYYAFFLVHLLTLPVSYYVILCLVTEELENAIKSEPDAKDCQVDLFARELETIQMNTEFYPEDNGTFIQDALIGEDGGISAPEQGSQLCRQPGRTELCSSDPWRLRLDYLVAYGPRGLGTFCMVCSQVLPKSKVSCFRSHIQECHPETSTLSRQEREAMAAAWTKECSREEIHHGEMPPPI